MDFGHAAVAEFAVVAGEPDDTAFDHGSVLSLFGLPVGVFCLGPGRTQCLVVDAYREVASPDGGSAPRYQRA
jgi:hypothetical protein